MIYLINILSLCLQTDTTNLDSLKVEYKKIEALDISKEQKIQMKENFIKFMEKPKQ